MELTNLRLIRNPRAESSVPAEMTALEGALTRELEEKIDRRATERRSRSGASMRPRRAEFDDEVRTAAVEWQTHAIDPLLLAAPGAAPSSPLEHLLSALGVTDRWLQSRLDDPIPQAFAQFRSDLLTSAISADSALFDEVESLIADWIGTELVAERRFDRLARLTRLSIVCAALDPRRLPDAVLADGQYRHNVRDFLQRRSLVMPPTLVGSPSGEQVQLVREAKVSDLFVVRSEWSCYQAGEIASIRNVLGGESFEHELRLIREEETITREERERIEATEQSEEDRTQSELTREVERGNSREIAIEGSVDVSGQYGLTKYAASAKVAANAALSETTRQASKIARDLVSKAVARVESRTREERTKRLLTKSEDFSKHAIDNRAAGGHLQGVYRWVDRIDRFQMFRFPDRLHLEFQIPEPGEYVRFRLAQPRVESGGLSEPPSFDLTPEAVTREHYAALALKYRAASLPSPPDAEIRVTAVVSGTMAQDSPTKNTPVWSMPRIEKTSEIAIPDGYGAVSLTYAAIAIPARANWRVEGTKVAPVSNKKGIEGFHDVSLTVLAGGSLLRHRKGGDILKDFTVQMSNVLGSVDRSAIFFEDAILQAPLPAHGQPKPLTINFGGAVPQKVSVGLQVAGASSASLTIELRCELQPAALREWQHTVYDTLLDAWRAWQQQWRTGQLQRLGPRLSAVDGTSPARNKQTIQEELKRQVITWLLNDAGFAGIAAVQERSDNWALIDLAAARAAAPVIQFMEQALEWGNMSYVCYPYYWAREENWAALADLEGADPNFLSFLRAGSSRVVVPARPGFERAVLHWLIYHEPFLGDPLPLPNDPLYISIASEIHDLTAGPPGGEPGDSWETRLSTALMWLDAEAKLPTNSDRRLGKAPNEPVEPLCSGGPT